MDSNPAVRQKPWTTVSREIFPASEQTVRHVGLCCASPVTKQHEQQKRLNHLLFILFLFGVVSAFGKSTESPEVTFVSPCESIGFHGRNRWIAKTDLSPVLLDKSLIQPVTPSQIYAWEGLGRNVDLTGYTEERMPSEQKWYALTGRIVDAKVESLALPIELTVLLPGKTSCFILSVRGHCTRQLYPLAIFGER